MTLSYCCPDAEARAAEIAAESDALFDLPDQPQGGQHL